MPGSPPSLEPIVRAASAYWATGAIRAALVHDVFSHLEAGVNTPEALARAASVSLRGARGLLDALTGLGLTKVESRRYTATDSARVYLTPSSPLFVGDFVQFVTGHMARFADFPEAVRTGEGLLDLHGVPDHPYWEQLVRGIEVLATPIARLAAQHLSIAEAGPIRVRDIGGGRGMFAAEFLAVNPAASAVQIDWANVNALARDFVTSRGVGDRFETRDGHFLELDYGEAEYDVIVYSQMAHGFTPAENREAFAKIHRALKPGGTLLINEYLLEEDGTAHPWVLLFSTNILFHSPKGIGWRIDEYESWLKEAGFTSFERVETPLPATLVLAR